MSQGAVVKGESYESAGLWDLEAALWSPILKWGQTGDMLPCVEGASCLRFGDRRLLTVTA